MKTRIEVTQEDIEKGKLGECSACPIALAMRRATGKPFEVGTDIYWLGFDLRSERMLPPEAALFVSDFDDKKPVQPFSFEIEL